MADKDERQIQSLIRLIDDMLDVSRIRTGKLSIRPSRTDLAQLVGNVVESFAAQMKACGCELRLERNEPIIGVWDAFRIEQVLANLLTNAMRYGAGKPVHVSVVSCADGACIEVRDHGIGISPQSLERIFCQFERAEGSESSAGLGLGLFIADQIVREALLTVSSDWPFMVSKDTASDYAIGRAHTHAHATREIVDAALRGRAVAAERLRRNWSRADNLFADLDARRLLEITDTTTGRCR